MFSSLFLRFTQVASTDVIKPRKWSKVRLKKIIKKNEGEWRGKCCEPSCYPGWRQSVVPYPPATHTQTKTAGASVSELRVTFLKNSATCPESRRTKDTSGNWRVSSGTRGAGYRGVGGRVTVVGEPLFSFSGRTASEWRNGARFIHAATVQSDVVTRCRSTILMRPFSLHFSLPLSRFITPLFYHEKYSGGN